MSKIWTGHLWIKGIKERKENYTWDFRQVVTSHLQSFSVTLHIISTLDCFGSSLYKQKTILIKSLHVFFVIEGWHKAGLFYLHGRGDNLLKSISFPLWEEYSTTDELLTVTLILKTNLWEIWGFLSLERHKLPSVPRWQQISNIVKKG